MTRYTDAEIIKLCSNYLNNLGVRLPPFSNPLQVVGYTVNLWQERKKQGLEISKKDKEENE